MVVGASSNAIPFVTKEWVEAISKGRWKQSQRGTILQDPTVGRENIRFVHLQCEPLPIAPCW
jgi:hypothetical protein